LVQTLGVFFQTVKLLTLKKHNLRVG